MAVPPSSSSSSPINPINFLIKREYNERVSVKNGLIRGRLANATNLFRKDLLSHYGCVNAIEFSNEGEFLISGGDDRRVLLWSVPHSILEKGEPVAMSTPHLSNIFCLGFSSRNHKIFSAGNDDQVIVHDTRSGYLLSNFLHEKPVYGLSINRQNDNVFASAGEDGRILIYDIREPTTTEPLCLAKYKTAFHAVMFNPIDPRFVATANTEEGIALWDNRKPRQPVIRYGNGARQNSGMSVRFNELGTKLLALRRRLPPVLYSVEAEKPLCQFYHPDYYNSCTMKSCCFAGDNDEYVLSGSDDFNLYMWRIPKDECEWGSIHIVLVGHRSIVNQVRYNKQNDIIASSGVEKMVKFWSTLNIGGFDGSLHQSLPDKPRQVFSHEEYISLVQNNGQLVSHDYSHQSTSEDSRMMAFFDSLVQREIEGWVMSDETLSSASDYDSSSNVDYLSQVPHESHRSFSSDRKGNRIAQLIYEKREKLAKMAQQKSTTSHRHKKREKQRKKKSSKLKSSCLKLSSKKGTTNSNRKSSSKHNCNSSSSSCSKQPPSTSVSASDVAAATTTTTTTTRRNNHDRVVATPSHKHKYKTRSNSARERDEVQSSESLDVPSTSTGITASTSGSSTVYRIFDQDSDDDTTANPTTTTTTNGFSDISSAAVSNVAASSDHLNEQQQLINILPTPLNGTHDMYINILQVPISITNGGNNNNNNNGVIVQNENQNTNNSNSNGNGNNNSNSNGDVGIRVRESDSSSGDSDVECEMALTAATTPSSNRAPPKCSNCDAMTPDSGIMSGSGASSSNRQLRNHHHHHHNHHNHHHHHHHLDENSDDPDWAYENFKKRVKRARFNFKNSFGADSDSN